MEKFGIFELLDALSAAVPPAGEENAPSEGRDSAAPPARPNPQDGAFSPPSYARTDAGTAAGDPSADGKQRTAWGAGEAAKGSSADGRRADALGANGAPAGADGKRDALGAEKPIGAAAFPPREEATAVSSLLEKHEEISRRIGKKK